MREYNPARYVLLFNGRTDDTDVADVNGYFANRGRSDTLAANTIPERYLSYVNAVNHGC